MRKGFRPLVVSDVVQHYYNETGELISPDTVRRSEGRGELRAMRTPGGVRLFDERDVDRWIERRRAAAVTIQNTGDAA